MLSGEMRFEKLRTGTPYSEAIFSRVLGGIIGVSIICLFVEVNVCLFAFDNNKVVPLRMYSKTKVKANIEAN